MDVKNLSWEQIKELAEIAMKNESDLSLTLCADGDCRLDISKHDYGITPITTTPIITTPITTTPSVTWNDSPMPINNIGNEPNNPYKVTC